MANLKVKKHVWFACWLLRDDMGGEDGDVDDGFVVVVKGVMHGIKDEILPNQQQPTCHDDNVELSSSWCMNINWA